MPSLLGDTRPKVLIVDDEPFISESLALAFRQNSFDARSAYSAESALDLLKNWGPDIAIIDICLARMNGIDFALRLREAYPDCRLLLFSGSTGTDAAFREAQDMGLEFASVEKPVQPSILIEAAKRLLRPGFTFARLS